jgi:sporulation protein YlmC with PRC-barrel domain
MAVTPLSELEDWKLVDEDQDLRGKALVDSSGQPLGTVEQMMVNTEAERVDSIRADNGELYPVGALEIRSDGVVVFHGIKTTGATKANVPEDAYRIRRRTL